jgi:hypothetical protein
MNKFCCRDDSYEHLSRTLELTRVHLFDIVTQYRALFSDEDPLMGSYGVPSPASHRLLFSTWLESKISQFLQTLEKDLDLGAKGQSLDSILSQAMYFGQSFGRVGADFRTALIPIFSKAVLEVALEHFQGSEQRFKIGIDQLALKASVTTNDADKKKSSDPFQPPISLLDFTPLAELCNTILLSLNEIRLCAPISLAPKMVDRIQDLLICAAQTLKDRELRFGKSSIDTERMTFQQLVTVFCQVNQNLSCFV